MGRLTKDTLLGASDLREEELELPAIGGSVIVQGLPAAFSNQASSEALELKSNGREQVATVNTAILEEIQLLHGLKDPKLGSREEARKFMEQNGPTARLIINKIDELSGVDKEAIENANNRFQAGGTKAAGSDVGNGTGPGSAGPDLPARDGDSPEDASGGDV